MINQNYDLDEESFNLVATKCVTIYTYKCALITVTISIFYLSLHGGAHIGLKREMNWYQYGCIFKSQIYLLVVIHRHYF